MRQECQQLFSLYLFAYSLKFLRFLRRKIAMTIFLFLKQIHLTNCWFLWIFSLTQIKYKFFFYSYKWYQAYIQTNIALLFWIHLCVFFFWRRCWRCLLAFTCVTRPLVKCSVSILHASFSPHSLHVWVCLTAVLVPSWDGIVFFTLSGRMLCCGFRRKTVLITHWCF